MRLEIGKINITDIRFAEESKIEKGVLYVNAEDLKPVVLEDEKIKDVCFDIAKPGESVSWYKKYILWLQIYHII